VRCRADEAGIGPAKFQGLSIDRPVLSERTFLGQHVSTTDPLRPRRSPPSFRAAQTARNLGGGSQVPTAPPPRFLALCGARNDFVENATAGGPYTIHRRCETSLLDAT
jgi:hypothetical protein